MRKSRRFQAPITLKTARQLKGITQTELAELAGVDQTTISDLEIGRNLNPSWETVARIALALGVEPFELFPLPDLETVAPKAEAAP